MEKTMGNKTGDVKTVSLSLILTGFHFQALYDMVGFTSIYMCYGVH
jgi:hypothetical protein